MFKRALALLSVTMVFTTFAADVYVATTGTDAAGYGTQAKPYKTIRYAVSQISSGKVLVAPGTYVETETVAGLAAGSGCVFLEKAVEVIGSSGNPSDVVITHGVWLKDAKGNDLPSPIVKLDHASAALRHVTVKDGAYLGGGNIHVTANGGLVEHCIAKGGGNGAWNSYGASVYLGAGRITRSRICENTTVSANGQADLDGTAQMDNCLLVDLTTGGAYAVKLNSNSKMINCTIARNKGTSCMGVWVNSKTAKVINCIIAGNYGNTATKGIVWSGANPATFINCATDLEIAGSTGNVYCRPSFIDYTNGDFRQSIVSACIDAGADVSAYDIGDIDFEGRPRKTGTIDIGCYENDKTTLSCGFNFSLAGVNLIRDYNSEYVSHTIPATLSLQGGVIGASGEVMYRWTLTDAEGVAQVRESSSPELEWELTTSGRYTIKLEVGGAVSLLADAFLLSPPILYLTGGNATPRSPYDTPATAATKLADVYAVAATGSKVIVTPDTDGEIEQNGEVMILRGINFVGYTGKPADTMLRNLATDSDAHRLMILGHPQAYVSGLTFKDGSSRSNGGWGGDIRIDNWGGTVSNCVFVNGSALHFSSQGGALAMTGGLCTHCVFTGAFATCPAYNEDPSSKGVVAYISGSEARLENSLFYDTVPTPHVSDGPSHGPIVSIINGTMRNCTVVPNTQLFKTPSTDSGYKRWNDNGGCAIYCGSGGKVENCAVANLKNLKGALIPFGGTLSRFSNCVGDGTQDLSAAVACKHATPAEMFIEPEIKDYRARALGALYNYGKSVPGFNTIPDLIGNRRVVKIIDVGAYESQYIPGFVITGRRLDR